MWLHAEQDQPLDDVDRVFGHWEQLEPPRDLASRVLARTSARAIPARAVLPWALVLAVGLGLLVWVGFAVGMDLARSGGLDLIEMLTVDLGLVWVAPFDLLSALAEVLPLGLIALAGFAGAASSWAAGRLSQVLGAEHTEPLRA